MEILAVENHKLCFDITQILSVFLGFFSTKHGIMLQLGLMFLVIHKSIDFYNEFYVQLLWEFFVVLNYDEMNYTLFFGVFILFYFYNVF